MAMVYDKIDAGSLKDAMMECACDRTGSNQLDAAKLNEYANATVDRLHTDPSLSRQV